MTAPDHLKITGPEDILGFIPHSLGYWPANSLVAMTMQGKRLGATLRVDLPDASRCRGPGLAAFARTIRDYLGADNDADGTLLAIFTGGPGEDATNDPAAHATETPAGEAAAESMVHAAIDSAVLARLLRELERTLGKAGLPVRDAWLVGERYWRNAYCTDPSCCAPPGRPIEEIRNSRLNAELVFRGSSVGSAPGRPARAAPDADEPAVLEAEEGWAREFAGRWREREQFGTVLDVWERVLEAGRRRTGKTAAAAETALPAGLAGYLRATLCVVAWRDAVLVMAAAGRDAAVAGAEDFGIFDGGQESPAALPGLDGFPAVEGAGTTGGGPAAGAAPAGTPGYGEVLLGLAPPMPDWGRLAELDRILCRLCNCGGGEARAAALTGRGWIEWCRGRGSYADALFIEATAERPGYRLAELLAELGRRGTLCGWARRRDAAWQKFDPDAA